MSLFGKKRAEEKKVAELLGIDQLRRAGYSDTEIRNLMKDLLTFTKLRSRGYSDEELREILRTSDKTGRSFIAEAMIHRATPEQKEKILKDIEKHPEYSADEIAVFHTIEMEDKMRERIYEGAKISGKGPVEETKLILKKIEKRQAKK